MNHETRPLEVLAEMRESLESLVVPPWLTAAEARQQVVEQIVRLEHIVALHGNVWPEPAELETLGMECRRALDPVAAETLLKHSHAQDVLGMNRLEMQLYGALQAMEQRTKGE